METHGTGSHRRREFCGSPPSSARRSTKSPYVPKLNLRRDPPVNQPTGTEMPSLRFSRKGPAVPSRRRCFFESLEDRRLMALAPELLKDINTTPSRGDSYPQQFVEAD